MAMVKHTPGPWHIIGEKDLPQVDDLMIVAFDVAAESAGETPDESLYICNIGSEGGAFGDTAPLEAGERWPVSLANAKLIAAAPTLADALEKRVRDNLDNGGRETDSSWMAEACAALRAAGRLP